MARKKVELLREAFPKDGDSISDIIMRSHRDSNVDLSLPLEKKSNDPEILRSLLEIERAIIKKARERRII